MTETVMIDDGETLASNDRYRVRVLRDHDSYSMFPEDEGAAPQVVYGTGTRRNMPDDQLAEDLREALERLGMGYYSKFINRYDAFDLFERWARVFRGVNAKVFETTGYCQGEHEVIITWPHAEWRESMSLPEDYTPTRDDVRELEAWMWGDVYYLQAERLTRWESDYGDSMETWEPIDWLHGFYNRIGDDATYIVEAAEDMLPEVDDIAA